MSFIYDNDKLVYDLIKSALDHNSKFNKMAQVAANPNSYYTLAAKLVDNLSKQYRGEETGIVSSKDDAPINIADLTTLGNFLDHIILHQITVDGKRVAFSGSETPTNKTDWLPTDAEKSIYGTEMMQGSERKPLEGKYYVNPLLLTTYINSLLASLSKKDESAQRFTKTMLGKIIEKANSLFGTKITTEYKAPEKVMSPDEIIDNVPKIISDSNISQQGGVALKYGDILSDVAIRNWVTTNSIEIGVIPEKSSGTMEYVGVKDGRKFDYCVVVKYLYNRAKYLLSNRATTVELKTKYNEYVKQMVKVGPTLSSPDGKACDIGASTATTQTTTSPQVAGYGPARVHGKTQLNSQVIQQLISILPLKYDRIDLNKISYFLQFYSKINPAISAITSDVESHINDISQIVFGNAKVFQLPTNNDRIQTLLQDKTQHYSFLQNLKYIIERCGTALLDLKSNYADYESGESVINQETAAPIDAQIKSPGSILENNISQIQTLLTNITSVQKVLKK